MVKIPHWPYQRRLTAAEESELQRRRFEDEPAIGAMGKGRGTVQLFRRYQKPPPLTVIAELPADETGDISDLDDYDYQLDR
jgi:hypothetical protein